MNFLSENEKPSSVPNMCTYSSSSQDKLISSDSFNISSQEPSVMYVSDFEWFDDLVERTSCGSSTTISVDSSVQDIEENMDRTSESIRSIGGIAFPSSNHSRNNSGVSNITLEDVLLEETNISPPVDVEQNVERTSESMRGVGGIAFPRPNHSHNNSGDSNISSSYFSLSGGGMSMSTETEKEDITDIINDGTKLRNAVDVIASSRPTHSHNNFKNCTNSSNNSSQVKDSSLSCGIGGSNKVQYVIFKFSLKDFEGNLPRILELISLDLQREADSLNGCINIVKEYENPLSPDTVTGWTLYFEAFPKHVCEKRSNKREFKLAYLHKLQNNIKQHIWKAMTMINEKKKKYITPKVKIINDNGKNIRSHQSRDGNGYYSDEGNRYWYDQSFQNNNIRYQYQNQPHHISRAVDNNIQSYSNHSRVINNQNALMSQGPTPLDHFRQQERTCLPPNVTVQQYQQHYQQKHLSQPFFYQLGRSVSYASNHSLPRKSMFDKGFQYYYDL